MIPALFSVSYAGLWGQQALDLETFLTQAAALGYPAVELMAKRPHLSVLDVDERRLAHLAQRAGELGVRIVTLAAYTDFTAGGQTRDIPFGEMQLAYVREVCRMARALGASIVRVFTGYTTDPHQARDHTDEVSHTEHADVTGKIPGRLGLPVPEHLDGDVVEE